MVLYLYPLNGKLEKISEPQVVQFYEGKTSFATASFNKCYARENKTVSLFLILSPYHYKWCLKNSILFQNKWCFHISKQSLMSFEICDKLQNNVSFLIGWINFI